ncbi:MAG: type I phosphomannose isomerase catalytic subunit [Velocimicrobium sp.]
MAILKLAPACKDYIWGGTKLKDEFGKKFDGDKLAETWELSCHPDGPCTILNKDKYGLTLQEYIEIQGKEILGTNCERFEQFPILIKLIDAKDNLSIQVHPDNTYALEHEKQYGKTEMWYVVDCKEGASLYYGFASKVTKEEFKMRIENNTLLEVLNRVLVKKGDVFFIEPGTIHAIGSGILIAEIQQNSNVTYRVYDYGRIGNDKKPRELHIDKALAVTNMTPRTQAYDFGTHIGMCDYFITDKIELQKEETFDVSNESFCSLLITEGSLSIYSGTEQVDAKKGDSILLTAGSGSCTLRGTADVIKTTIGGIHNV